MNITTLLPPSPVHPNTRLARFFSKLNCCQAYHFLQLADKKSIQLLSLNFGSQTFAYKCSEQSLNFSLPAFTSFVREYLDPVVQANRCAQHVDDIGVAAHTTDELLAKFKLVFQCIDETGYKLSLDKHSFRQEENEFLNGTLVVKDFDRLKRRLTFFKKMKFPTKLKALYSFRGFVHFYRQYLLN